MLRYASVATAHSLAIVRPASDVIEGGNQAPFAIQPIIKIVDAAGNTVTSATNAVTAKVMSGSSTVLVSATVNAVNGVADFSGENLFTDTTRPTQIVFESGDLLKVYQSVAVMPRPETLRVVSDATAVVSTPGTWVRGDFYTDPSVPNAVLRVSDVMEKIEEGLEVKLATSTGDITMEVAISSSPQAGSLTLDAGRDTFLRQDIKLAGATSSLVVKAARNIVTTGGAWNNYRELWSSNGNLVLWANSNDNNQGTILIPNYTELKSNGGDIFIAGGAATTSGEVEVPGGYAVAFNGTFNDGVRFGTSQIRDQVRVLSEGGDIVVRGSTNQNSRYGILGYAGNRIHSGTGVIDFSGTTFGNQRGMGIRLNWLGGAAMGSFLISESTQNPAIRMHVNNDSTGSWWGLYIDEGAAMDTRTDQDSIDRNGGNSYSQSARAIALNRMPNIWGKGGIDIDVTQRIYAHSIMARGNFLAETGDITLDAGNKSIYFNGASSRGSYFGSMPNSPITSSSANINLHGAYFAAEDYSNFFTNGELIADPGSNSDFTASIYFPRTTTVIGNDVNTPSKVRIGRFIAGSGDGLGNNGIRRIELNRTFDVNGPLEVYGGSVLLYQTISASGGVSVSAEYTAYLYGNLRVTGENNDIRVYAEDRVLTNGGKSFTTNGGNIIFGPHADGTDALGHNGDVYIASGVKINTANGLTDDPDYNNNRGHVIFAAANSFDENGFPNGLAEAYSQNIHGVNLLQSNGACEQRHKDSHRWW